MKWLLDTNVCIDVLRGRSDVVACFQKHSRGELVLSVVTEFELLQGAVRAPKESRAAEKQKVKMLLAQLKIVKFDSECAQQAAEINGSLMNAGTPVGVMDVFIAATALRLGVPLITSNLRDFSRIDDLSVIDWRKDR